jgi:glycerophosphoryl diester phosphodiesterase
VRHPYFDLATPLVIGHRGAAGEVPENTLASFRFALEGGAQILESDLHATRDGTVVMCHDPEVDRTTDGSGRIGELAFADLARLDAGQRFSRDGGASHPFRGRGLRIPALREAFAAFPAARFNLELKQRDPALVDHTLELVAEFERADRTLLTAADDELMALLRRRLREAGIGAAVGACTGDVVAFVRAAAEGTPAPPDPMALQIPAEFAGRPLVTPELVRAAHERDVQVHVWTVNEPAEMERLLDLGVDGLVTDFPGRLAKLVAARRGAR